MRVHRPLQYLLLLTPLLVLGAYGWGGAPAPGPPPAGGPDGAKKGGLTKYYFGVGSCNGAGCHTSPDRNIKPGPVLARCTEAETWLKEDRHRGAHAVLKGKLARRMGELLHPRYKKEVWEEPACVSCHGLVAGEKSP